MVASLSIVGHTFFNIFSQVVEGLTSSKLKKVKGKGVI